MHALRSMRWIGGGHIILYTVYIIYPPMQLYKQMFIYSSRFVSGAVYYGLSFNVKNIAGDRYINFFLSGLVEIPALIFVVLVNNRY